MTDPVRAFSFKELMVKKEVNEALFRFRLLFPFETSLGEEWIQPVPKSFLEKDPKCPPFLRRYVMFVIMIGRTNRKWTLEPTWIIASRKVYNAIFDRLYEPGGRYLTTLTDRRSLDVVVNVTGHGIERRYDVSFVHGGSLKMTDQFVQNLVLGGRQPDILNKESVVA